MSRIGVGQFGPLTARALRRVYETKLKDLAMRHFAAFADPA